MIGTGFVLSDATIVELCDRATTIMSKEDLNGVILLRPEYCERLFRVIRQIVSCAPSPKKKNKLTCIYTCNSIRDNIVAMSFYYEKCMY